MRRLLLSVLAGLVALTPLAVAQGPVHQTSFSINLTPPEYPLTAEEPRLTLDGLAAFLGDPTYAALETNGIPVEYTITQAPAWASVVVSPSNDVIPLSLTLTRVEGYRPFTVLVQLSDDLEASVVETLEITATIRPNSFGAVPKSVSISVPLSAYVPSEAECEEHIEATVVLASPAQQEEPAAPAPEEELTVQSGGVTPVATWYAIGGFGLAGAAAGFVLLRRRSR